MFTNYIKIPKYELHNRTTQVTLRNLNSIHEIHQRALISTSRNNSISPYFYNIKSQTSDNLQNNAIYSLKTWRSETQDKSFIQFSLPFYSFYTQSKHTVSDRNLDNNIHHKSKEKLQNPKKIRIQTMGVTWGSRLPTYVVASWFLSAECWPRRFAPTPGAILVVISQGFSPLAPSSLFAANPRDQSPTRVWHVRRTSWDSET